MEKFWNVDKLWKIAEQDGPKALLCIGILACGNVLSRIFVRWAQNALANKEIEPPVKLLIVRLLRLMIFILTLLIILDTLGVKITALVTGLGVVGVGLGLAMQQVLSNVVAGLTIIFTKPFKVGDYVEIEGTFGQVTHVDLSSSTISRGDLSQVIIPNRQIVGEIVRNFGNIKQLELSVGVSYASDINQAIALVRDILLANGRVLASPAPFVGISSLADSAIVLSIKPWTKVADSGPAQAEIYQAILDQFRSKKIEIPYPQHEVRLLNPPANTP